MQELFDQLDVLADDKNAWDLNLTRRTATVGSVRITIDAGEIETAWMVESIDEDRMVTNGWKPEPTLRHSMKESTDFARAYLISVNKPQHQEN